MWHNLSCQGKDRQRKKKGMSSAAKSIRLNAKGDVYLEDSTVPPENAVELDTGKAGTRKVSLFLFSI